MQQATVIFNRQVLRLCKGVLKAWEQWIEEMEMNHADPFGQFKPQKQKDEDLS